MKYLIMILLFHTRVFASTYYVDNVMPGSDANSGTSPASPFLTIAKAISIAAYGDIILLKAGCVWNEKFNVPFNKITFSSYSSGARPQINALKTVPGWTDSTHIWSATVSDAPPNLNLVVINNRPIPKSRFPNIDYFIPKSSGSNSNRIVTLLMSKGDTLDYTGAEAAVRTTHWIIDVRKISSRPGDTLYFTDTLSKPGYQFSGNGYFLQNDLRFMDTPERFTYDSATKKLRIYSIDTPRAQYSTKDTLIFLSEKDTITFDGIDFIGANKVGIQIDTSRNVSVTNSTLKIMGGMAIRGMKNQKFTLQNDSLYNILDNGLSFWPSKDGVYIPSSPLTNLSDSCLFNNNYFKNIGFIAGMGGTGNVHYEGLMSVGNDCTLTNNRFDSTGYSSLYFNGVRTLIQNNYITNYCFIKDDGAGIQSGLGGAVPDNGSIVKKNVIINGIGNNKGVSNISGAVSIYVDDANVGTIIDSNVVCFSTYDAISAHNNDSLTFTNNLVINDSRGDGLRFEWVDPDVMRGFVIKGNILCILDSSDKYPFYSSTGTNTFAFSMDSNYYLRPLKNTNPLYLNGSAINLSSWQSSTGKDAHSIATRPSGTLYKRPYFYYNPTNSDSTIVLPFESLIDVYGTVYRRSMVLHPFTGALLFERYPTNYIGRKRIAPNLNFK